MDEKEKLEQKIKSLESASPEKVKPFVKKWFVKASEAKRSENRESLMLFWQSDIPIVNFNELKDQYYFDSVILAYFEFPININTTFIEQFIENDCLDRLIQILKISKGFLNDEHWESLQFLRKRGSLKKIFFELEFIRKILQNWENKAVSFNERVLHVSSEDLLIQSLSYFEYFKRYSLKTMGNNSQLTAYETHFISVLDYLLTHKKVGGFEPNEGYDIKGFSGTVKQELPPIRPTDTLMNPNYVPNEKISPLKKEVRTIVDFFIQKDIQTYQIENYLCGFASFEDIYIDDLEAELLTTKSFNDYRSILERGVYEENYFVSKIVKDEDKKNLILNFQEQWDREFQLHIEKANAYFEFYCLPEEIHLEEYGQPISTKKVLLLLYTFSKLFSPQGRIVVTGNSDKNMIARRGIQERFSTLFESDYLIGYNYDDFILKTSEYFEWSEQETKIIIDYLTTNLNNDDNCTIDLKKRPLLKSGGKIIWLSSFLRDRKWEVLLHKRITNGKVKNYNPNQRSTDLEQNMANLFKNAGFGAKASHEYDGGEIDTIAYKENTLFLLELKTTYVEENIMSSQSYELLKFNALASDQLERATKYVKENYLELTLNKELNITCSLNELKIKRLIISNVFDGDGSHFTDLSGKISLLELAVILRNELDDLYISQEAKVINKIDMEIPLNTALSMMNTHSKDKKTNSVEYTKADGDLWSNSDSPSAEDFITAIEENKVWKFQRTPFLGDLVKSECKTWERESTL